MMGGIRGDKDSQGKRGQISSMEVRSMFEERRVQLKRSWKYEGFLSLDYKLPTCEMIDPYIAGSVRLKCAGDLKIKYER